MNRFFYSLAVLAFVFASCSKENVGANQENEQGSLDKEVFSASIEQPGAEDMQKTTIESDATVLWSNGDQIKIWDSAGKSAIYSTVSTGETAEFTQVSKEDGFDVATAAVAQYPASAAGKYNNGTVRLKLPATQTYYADGFAPGFNMAIGAVDPKSLHIDFKNTLGILKIKLKGTAKVSKIVLTDAHIEGAAAKAGTITHLYGTFTASVNEPAATYYSGGGNSVTLDCGDGVQLKKSTEKAFYIMVPAGVLTEGFVAEVYDMAGHPVKVLYTEKTTFATQRSYIRKVAVQTANKLPASYTGSDGTTYSITGEAKYIGNNFDSNGGNYINTTLKTNESGNTVVPIRCRAKFTVVDKAAANFLLCAADAKTEDRRVYICNTGGKNFNFGYGYGKYFTGTSDSHIEDVLAENGETYEVDVQIKKDLQFGFINGTLSWCNVASSKVVSAANYYLFAVDKKGGDVKYGGKEKLHHLTVIQNGAVVRNMIPVQYDSKNYGLYDTVTEKLFRGSNISSYPFTGEL